jgi:signal transduction histidine kinase
MGKLKYKSRSLKASFVWMVFITVLLVTALSFVTILGCTTLRNSLVPNDDEIILTVRTITAEGQITEEEIRMRANKEPNTQLLPSDYEQYTEYTVEPVYSPIRLSPKRQLLYNALPVFMVGLPLIFAIAGIIICSFTFYRKKLNKPLAVLSDSSEKISNDDLDFTVTYSSADEMGMLCASFEKMRAALLESKRTVWNMMEERRQLNASVAHDLRTPITIIEGYTEYLRHNIPKGKIDENKLMETLGNLSEAADRLERYVDSVRDIQSLDEIELHKETVSIRPTVEEMSSDLEILANTANKDLCVSFHLDDTSVQLDKQALYRILENTVSNALRYAVKSIKLSFVLDEGFLDISVSDDGEGFSPEDLKAACSPFYKETDTDGHMGLGLSICNILSKKHGGELSISNTPEGGAMVNIRLSVR